MAIIADMGKVAEKKTYVRTTPAIKAELKRLLVDLGQARAFAARNQYLAQEVVVAASWLWMKSLDVETLASELEPYINAVEAGRESETGLPPIQSLTGAAAHKNERAASRTNRKRG